MTIHSRSLRIATLCLLPVAQGCSQDTNLTGLDRRQAQAGARAATLSAPQGTLSFTIGPLVITGIEQEFPGHNWHLRDVQLSGPVSGDVTGQANVALNANLDGILGSGPVSGTVSLVSTAGEIWQGSLTGSFQSGLPAIGIQLFSRVVLQGPDQQQLHAECDETTATSETLVCTGRVVNPHE